MYDGFNILNFPKYPDEVLAINEFHFKTELDRETGLITKEYHEHKGLRINIKPPGLVKVRGSFHKFFNNGLHNYNQFNFTNVIDTLINFCELFKVNPFTTHLNGLEFGVNINISQDVNALIESIKMHKGTNSKGMSIKDGYGITFKHENYIIKIYNKSKQYQLTDNVIRFEVSVNVMRFFKENKIKIKTISDLFNYETIMQLGDHLLKQIDELLLFDSDNLQNNITDKIKVVLLEKSNPNYWTKLKPKSRDYENGNNNSEYKRARKKYYREFKTFNTLLSNYQINDLKNDFKQLVETNIKELTKVNETIFYKVKNYLNYSINYSAKNYNQNNTKGTNSDFSYSMSLSPSENITEINNRFCKVTGLNISMQKLKSEFLCITGLKFYKENQPETFIQLKEKYLTESWATSSEDIQLTEIAHNIRNKANNTKLSFSKINNYPTLFDNSTLVSDLTLRCVV